MLACALVGIGILVPISSSLASESGRAYHARTQLNQAEEAVDEVEFTLDGIEDLIRKSKYLSTWSDEGVPETLEGIAGDLKKIPPDYPRLMALQKRMRGLLARLEALEKQATPALEAYGRETDMKRFPDFDRELRLTGIIQKMYAVSDNAFEDPMEVVEHVRQVHAAVGFLNGNAAKYAPLVNLKTAEGERFDEAQRAAIQAVRAFLAQWRLFGKKGPDHVRGLVTRANAALRKAEVVGGLAYVVGAREWLRKAAAHLHVLSHAVGPLDIYDAPAMQADFDQARASLARVEQSVMEELTASNRAPKDAYGGPDRAELESAVRVAWAQRDLRAEVLAVRVHEANWRRFTGLRWQPEHNGWETFDQERLSITVVIRKDNRRATLHDVVLSREPDTKRLDLQTDPVIGPRDMLMANL